MRGIRRFATAHPLPFVIVAPVVWMMIGGIAAYLAARALQLPPTHKLPQSLGTLVATACVLLVMWRWQWLRAAGVTALGSGRLWLVTTGLMVLIAVAYQLAFFDRIVVDFSTVLASAEAQATLKGCALVGFVEETLFRGFLLYALVRVWGDTRRGLLAAVTLPALLFGLPHIMQVWAGNPLDDTLMTMLNCFVSGLWYGALVLLGGSIWPAVLIHAATNASFQISAASLTGFDPSATGYALATMAELPLVIAGLWLLLRQAPVAIPTGRQKWVAKASTSASTISRLFLLVLVLGWPWREGG
jgi:membrane protease YdiL (CAAX protease family)